MQVTVKKSRAMEKNTATSRMSQFKGYMARHWALYAMLVPPVVFLFIFAYMPMPHILLAFTENNVMRPPWENDWVGLAHLNRAFSLHPFTDAVRNTLVFSALDLIVGFPAPIVLALLLNEIKFKRFKKITQTISYLPNFISWIIIGGLATQLFSSNTGVVNDIIVRMGGQPVPFLETNTNWVIMNVLISVWRSVGWGSILYLASLLSISPELYEAAEIDGASRLRKMWHISLPGIRPTIVTLLILTLGGIMGASLDRFMALENAFVRGVSEVIPTFIFRWGLQSFQFALAAAIGIFQSIIGMILLLGGNWIAKKLGGNGFW